MKYRIEHEFRGIDRPGYERLYFDERFQSALAVEVKLGRTVVRLDRGPERIVRHVRLEPEREIPAPMAKLLGGKKLTLDEELDYEVGRYRGRFRTTPGVLPGKVSISGTLAVEAVPGGVRRVVEGEIVVSVFAIGGMVEKHVVGNLEKSYGDAAAFTRKWLEGAR